MRRPRLPKFLRSPEPFEPPRGLVLVDARNVQRSAWPNPSDSSFVEALEAWALEQAPDEDVVAVFDGEPDAAPDGPVLLVATDYADDELVARAIAAHAEGRSVRVATSDRALRLRLEAAGAHISWGGGAMLGELGFARRRGDGRGVPREGAAEE
ncbi:MAG: hypothetical protein JWM86_1300 [Thermoleophilia bacterium]|nr:hypothetical protein [Thermoleophilia bacterium]